MGEQFKRLFELEEARREQLRTAVAMPVGVLTVIVGLLGTTIVSYWKGSGLPHLLFVTFWVLAILSAVAAAYFLVRSYHGHSYKGMPTPSPLWEHLNALRHWHKDVGSPEEAVADFEAYLENLYATCGEFNTKRNDIRSDFLFLANRMVILTAIFAAVAYIPFTVNQVYKLPTITHVVVDSVPQLQSVPNAR